MKNTITRNTILENKLRYRASKKTIGACLRWTTLVKSYVVKWCDNRVCPSLARPLVTRRWKSQFMQKILVSCYGREYRIKTCSKVFCIISWTRYAAMSQCSAIFSDGVQGDAISKTPKNPGSHERKKKGLHEHLRGGGGGGQSDPFLFFRHNSNSCN